MSNLQDLLGQFLGAANASGSGMDTQSLSQAASGISDKIPGGLMGGAAAGGIVALLLGNKKARKLAGKAAGYGGAAVIGGLAYRALQNWQQSPGGAQAAPVSMAPQAALENPGHDLQLKIITAMIAAAKADGHIDSSEQERVFSAMDQMDASAEIKALVFDLLRQPISVADVCAGVTDLEHKAEIFMASCLAIDEDDPRERAYLEQLAQGLQLPAALVSQLKVQADGGTGSAPDQA
jgi:uncharacterized membrane protein YebE (DUF533 family)